MGKKQHFELRENCLLFTCDSKFTADFALMGDLEIISAGIVHLMNKHKELAAVVLQCANIYLDKFTNTKPLA